MAKRHFYEIFDASGNRVCEIIALEVMHLEGTHTWLIELVDDKSHERAELLLPDGFSVRLMA